MKLRKHLVLVIMGLFLVGLVSNAGVFDFIFKKGNKKESKQVETAKKAVELTMWVTPDAEHEADLKNIIKKFEDKTGMKVKITVLGWDIVWDKLTTAATSGIGPDVVEIGGTWVSSIAAMGVLEDLSKYYKDDMEKDYLPATLKYSSTVGVPGKMISLPWVTDGYLWYYRKDLYEKAGLDPKKVFDTWDSFSAAMKKLDAMNFKTDKGEKIPAFAHGGKNDWNIIHMMGGFIWQNGGNYISADGKKSLIADPKSVEAIKYFTNFARTGIVPKKYLEKDPSEIEAIYGEGGIATILTGPWFAAQMDKTLSGLYDTETDDKTSLAKSKFVYKNTDVAEPLAGSAGRYTFSGTNNLAVFNFSKHKKEAAGLVKYLTDDEGAQIAYAKATGLFPVSVAAVNSPFVTENHYRSAVKYAFDHDYVKVYPSVPAWGPIETVLTKNLGLIWDLVSGVDGKYTDEKLMKVIDETKREMNLVISQTGTE
ncbi:extracellular solute-binding protein [Haliovirga abyssi]|uniref:Sugar ABC transporter substrate-binding protein n=1 Tax=Haliovirga abyssi TaxID=2996794 RepID=A0AAU9DYI2_9FUSO|nr:extracellular solute-binding protein [Haliovirga abyssi]BDU51586.1 sugar ABC transporter substrate-binding protein [Haliovirga abyssi]